MRNLPRSCHISSQHGCPGQYLCTSSDPEKFPLVNLFIFHIAALKGLGILNRTLTAFLFAFSPQFWNPFIFLACGTSNCYMQCVELYFRVVNLPCSNFKGSLLLYVKICEPNPLTCPANTVLGSDFAPP